MTAKKQYSNVVAETKKEMEIKRQELNDVVMVSSVYNSSRIRPLLDDIEHCKRIINAFTD